MNILFCGDENVCQGIFLSALSVSKHTEKALSVYILTARVGDHRAIEQGFPAALEHTLRQKNKESRVFLFDLSREFDSYLPLANMGTRFTPLCMLRLFADKVPEIPDRILYLDADVLCRAPFDEMYEMRMENHEIAGVPDRYGKWFFGNPLRHTYLNSGVLLMNMANIRESGLFANCREMCREKKMFMPDQTALNKLAVKKKLPSRYNAQGKIRKDTVFKHFTTFFRFFPYPRAVTVKPWQTEKMHEELGIFEFDELEKEYQRSKQ